MKLENRRGVIRLVSPEKYREAKRRGHPLVDRNGVRLVPYFRCVPDDKRNLWPLIRAVALGVSVPTVHDACGIGWPALLGIVVFFALIEVFL